MKKITKWKRILSFVLCLAMILCNMTISGPITARAENKSWGTLENGVATVTDAYGFFYENSGKWEGIKEVILSLGDQDNYIPPRFLKGAPDLEKVTLGENFGGMFAPEFCKECPNLKEVYIYSDPSALEFMNAMEFLGCPFNFNNTRIYVPEDKVQAFKDIFSSQYQLNILVDYITPIHTHVAGTKHDPVSGNCVDKGTIEWYECTGSTCEDKLDKDGNKLTSIEGNINPDKHKSDLTHIDEVAPKKDEYGCKEYWKCESCKNFYSAEAGTTASKIADLAAWKADPAGGQIHYHKWSYQSSDNKITVNCTTDPTHTATLTLTAEEAQYTGNPYTGASYGAGEELKWFKMLGEDAPVITYEGTDGTTYAKSETAPTAMGTYLAKATYTYGENQSVEAVKSFKIINKEISKVTFTAPETPAAGGTPETTVTVPDTASYTGTVTWSPADTTFVYNTAYTASITLTAKDGCVFADKVTTAAAGWTEDQSKHTQTTIVLKKTYGPTAKAKILDVTAPAVTPTQLTDYTTESVQIASLTAGFGTASVEVEGKTEAVPMAVIWKLKNGTTYSTEANAENTFVWTIKADEYADYDPNGKDLTGEVTLKNPDLHIHRFTYTAAGPVITAKCSTANCPLTDGEISMTLETGLKDNTKVYDETAAAAVFNADELSAFKTATGIKDEDIVIRYVQGTVIYQNAPTEAGSYTAEAAIKGATAKLEFTITKKEITAPSEDATIYTYNGSSQTYQLTAADGYTISGSTTQKNAGSYQLKAILSDKKNTCWDDQTSEDKGYTFTIGRKKLTITADSKSAKVGDARPKLTYQEAGLEVGDTLITAPELTCDADMKKADEYDIIAFGADAGSNYSITYVKGKLTVSEKAIQTITADNVTAVYGDTDKEINASTSGDGVLSYAVKYGSSVVDVDADGRLTIKKAGTAVVAVTAAETAAYAKAEKDVTVTIDKKTLTVTAEDVSAHADGAVPAFTCKTVTAQLTF